MTIKRTPEAAILRLKAEVLLKLNHLEIAHPLSDIDKQKLQHELEVHQIELELQNEDLLLALSAAQNAIQLYDFAPMGYYTLSNNGEIIKLNLIGARMLGKERQFLINSRFGFFVSNDTKPTFNLFLEKIFISNKHGSCDLTLIINGNKPMYVHLTGIVAQNTETCLVTVVDITAYKLAADALKEESDKLEQFNNFLIDREIQMIELKKEINGLLIKAGGEAKYDI
jgi:hypothetical protein